MKFLKYRAQRSILNGKLLEISKERKKNVLYKYCGDAVLSNYLSFFGIMYENLKTLYIMYASKLKKKIK